MVVNSPIQIVIAVITHVTNPFLVAKVKIGIDDPSTLNLRIALLHTNSNIPMIKLQTIDTISACFLEYLLPVSKINKPSVTIFKKT